MGKVYLIGAGPGDPELMTLKAARALRLADVVLIDELVNRGCLAHARSDVRVIEVGKRGGCTSTPQAFIEKLMVLHCREGKTVARLKGGDPFIFGRGGEEAEKLKSYGIDVEVIPGVTAGTAVPAAAGIPLTHRDIAHGVTFLTGHTSESEPDWKALVRSGMTLVIYMGLRNVERIASRLRTAGMDPRTPACIIENGTLRSQRHQVATLAELSGAGFSGPAIIVIGEVASFARILATEPAARAA
jgi:uroporphyrin-III C-methyltransferase